MATMKKAHPRPTFAHERSPPLARDEVDIYISLSLSIYIYIYIYTHICMSIYIYIHICIYLSLYIYIYTHTHVYHVFSCPRCKAPASATPWSRTARPVPLIIIICITITPPCHILPPSEIDWRLFGLFLQARKATIYFTALAGRVEYGNYVTIIILCLNCVTVLLRVSILSILSPNYHTII